MAAADTYLADLAQGVQALLDARGMRRVDPPSARGQIRPGDSAFEPEEAVSRSVLQSLAGSCPRGQCDVKRILCVEDIPAFRRLIRIVLELEGIEVREADNGPAGVAMALACPPDLVLMDIAMPGEYDGLEACRRIRANPSLAAVPIMILSANDHSDQRERALGAGANHYCAKPFRPRQFVDLVCSLLAGAAVKPVGREPASGLPG